jgi:hypothetical protein
LNFKQNKQNSELWALSTKHKEEMEESKKRSEKPRKPQEAASRKPPWYWYCLARTGTGTASLPVASSQ